MKRKHKAKRDGGKEEESTPKNKDNYLLMKASDLRGLAKKRGLLHLGMTPKDQYIKALQEYDKKTNLSMNERLHKTVKRNEEDTASKYDDNTPFGGNI
jgi:hypothetical protein